jgi:hypothetical protein
MPTEANSNVETQLFDMREDPEGWTVYDSRNDEPAQVKGVAQVGLEMEKADDLVDLLNRLAHRIGERFSL